MLCNKANELFTAINELIPFYRAHRDGKCVEFRFKHREDDWLRVDGLFNGNEIEYLHSTYEFRIKPEPKLRPWRPEEVPVGAQYRGDGWNLSERRLISQVYNNNVEVGNSTFTLNELLAMGKHSLDNGKTWHPCGVEE